ncbi:unnamed protein product [Nyctereutes procyonoides]|uniref:(raccoon dog) hypothetical protein n=1 Tax=Nyctereutes procyonoides TaxID=34880 RepID=A0A811Z6T0_NYCPR|nr:unnamed protein product [Nyctereutes procyonoides]
MGHLASLGFSDHGYFRTFWVVTAVPPPLPWIPDPWGTSCASSPLSNCCLATAGGIPQKGSNKEGAKEGVGHPGRAAAQQLISEPQGLAKTHNGHQFGHGSFRHTQTKEASPFPGLLLAMAPGLPLFRKEKIATPLGQLVHSILSCEQPKIFRKKSAFLIEVNQKENYTGAEFKDTPSLFFQNLLVIVWEALLIVPATTGSSWQCT